MSELPGDVIPRFNPATSDSQQEQPGVILFLLIMILMVVLTFRFSSVIDWSKLPPTKRLILLAESACRDYEQRTGDRLDWSLKLVANSHAYTGNFPHAMRISRSLIEPIDAVAIADNWKIHAEVTTDAVEFPPIAINDADVSAKIMDAITRGAIATVLVTSGREAEANRVMPSNSIQRHSAKMFVSHHLDVAKVLVERNDRVGAATHLKRAVEAENRVSMSKTHDRITNLVHVANLWEQIGNREEAIRLITDLGEELLADISRGDLTSLTIEDLARLGQFWAGDRINNRSRSEAFFYESLRLAEVSFERKQEEGHLSLQQCLKDHVDILARIGAKLFAAGWKVESRRIFDRSIDLVRSEVMRHEEPHRYSDEFSETSVLAPPDFEADHDYRLRKLVDRQIDAGDYEGATKTVLLLYSLYWRCQGLVDVGKEAAKSGDPRYREYLDQAESLARAESSRSYFVGILPEIAEAHALMGNHTEAKRYFQAATEECQKPKAFQQQGLIARAQIRAGYYEDAFRSIGAAPDEDARVLPLAELARAVAMKEALSNRLKRRDNSTK